MRFFALTCTQGRSLEALASARCELGTPRISSSTRTVVASSQLEELASARLELASKLPMHTHRIAGVTFDGRQENLRMLTRLSPSTITVILEREPENPYDPNAVAVKLVDGTKLGYIPRIETGAFVYSLTFGRIRSIGQAANTENYGCIVEVQPKLPPVVNLSLPAKPKIVKKCAGLVESLAGPNWESYKADLCRQMNNRCSISNVETTAVEARWAMLSDPSGKQVVKLTAFALQHPYLSKMQYVDPENFVDLDEIAGAISVLNPGMTVDEATMVFTRQEELAEARAGEDWMVDTSLLDTLLEGRRG